MNFASIEVLGWFFALVAIYWCLPKRWQLHWVSFLTVVFLGFYSPLSLIVLVSVVLICYFLGKSKTGVAISLLVAILIGYRLIADGNPMETVTISGVESHSARVLVLLGFSYYILRAIHYLVERMKGKVATHSFSQLFNYLFFLPTLVVGPINRFDDFVRDSRRRRWDSDLFSYGITRIVYGLTKIVFIAYFLVNRKMDAWMGNLEGVSLSGLQYLECWQYALNLYFQFSGYCDVAIGVAALLGFRINENFNYPFLKPNISEFWRSWHMSLTNWSREYIYPTVSSTTRSPYLAIFVSMVFIGLWHEFSFKYLLWGFYHGFGILLHRCFEKLVSGLGTVRNVPLRWAIWSVNVLITLHFVVIGFILNKEETIADSWTAFKQLVGV